MVADNGDLCDQLAVIQTMYLSFAESAVTVEEAEMWIYRSQGVGAAREFAQMHWMVRQGRGLSGTESQETHDAMSRMVDGAVSATEGDFAQGDER